MSVHILKIPQALHLGLGYTTKYMLYFKAKIIKIVFVKTIPNNMFVNYDVSNSLRYITFENLKYFTLAILLCDSGRQSVNLKIVNAGSNSLSGFQQPTNKP